MNSSNLEEPLSLILDEEFLYSYEPILLEMIKKAEEGILDNDIVSILKLILK